MKYSIITINYNNRNGLKETIESVINQSCKDFEYLVIDGGSTDGSVEIIQQYADKISYWVSEADRGIYHAMNKGIEQAHGEYLNFMNSGDCFSDNFVLENIINSLCSYDIVTGKVICDGKIGGFWKTDITMLDLAQGTLAHQATFIKKTLFSNRTYDETLKIISDWKFWIETLIFDNASFLNTNVLVSKIEPYGISMTNQKLRIEEGAKVYNELFPKRIQKDYFRWEKIDSPLAQIVAEFNHTPSLQKLVKTILLVLVKLKNIKQKRVIYNNNL